MILNKSSYLVQPQNLIYLDQHGLIDMSNEGFDMWMCHMQITHKGIDFLEQDGGLSAIFDTITIKLHNESIQALLKEKINQSDIPEEEKGYLISELMKIKDAALNTLTENAINNISAVTVVSWLKAAIGL
ncbi:hypothetical protein J2T38_002326 [Neisseria perflava]|uniref:hypothetical protein n=1 Tax=Neisseria perflava TaxID=33053 RepID=UPI00209F86D2|nr:hypothetical protein [Neisseria perflava]MCP1773472.1 hypothetical protein [Neisseria perflava]